MLLTVGSRGLNALAPPALAIWYQLHTGGTKVPEKKARRDAIMNEMRL
jgi:hypothetical protein